MKRILAFTFLAITMGCSNYVRKADPGVSLQDVLNKLQTLESQSGDPSITSNLSSDSIIYYSEGPGPLGPPVSVAAMTDLSVFNSGDIIDDVSSVQVFMIYTPSAGTVSLLVGITGSSGTPAVTSFTGNFSSDKNGFTATENRTNGNGTLTLASNDVNSDGNLADVIQVDVTSSAGYLGKFSTLVGFAQ